MGPFLIRDGPMPRYKRRKLRKIERRPTALMSVQEFCDNNGISIAHYYVLRANGDGPREVRTGRRVFVSPEAEADWRRAHEKKPRTK